MPKKDVLTGLSKREQQIMDCIYRRGKGSAGEVHGAIPNPPSYSAVRALLRILVDKGHLRHEKDGPRYIYYPIRTKRSAGLPALRRVIETFFDGSIEKTLAALVKVSDKPLSPEQLDALQDLIHQTKKTRRRKP